MRYANMIFAATLIVLSAPDAVDAGQADSADPMTVTPQSDPWLLGDWRGERTRLHDQGIDFQFGYVGEFAENPVGGLDTKARYADQYTAGVTFDLDRLLDIPDAKFQLTLTQRTGRNLSDDADLGTLQQVQEIYGRGQTIRLTDFWYEQGFANGLVDWKIGRMPVNEDFATFPCDFQNLTFCGSDLGNLVGNYIYNWPISQWATRIRVNLKEFGYVQIGVYDVNPKYLGVHDQVLPVFFSHSTGALIPVELAWLPAFHGGRLPGSYKIGAWYDTSDADDVVEDVDGGLFELSGLQPRRRHGRYGAYLSIQQQLTENLSLFLNAVIADRRTSTTDRQIAAGMIYKGPFPSRPDDDVGFAAGTTHINDRVLNRTGRGDSEYAFELYYTYRPRPGLLFRPNVQYIHDPGGGGDNDDVVTFGLKTSATF